MCDVEVRPFNAEVSPCNAADSLDKRAGLGKLVNYGKQKCGAGLGWIGLLGEEQECTGCMIPTCELCNVYTRLYRPDCVD